MNLCLAKYIRYLKLKYDTSPQFIGIRKKKPGHICIITQSLSSFISNVLEPLKDLIGAHNIDLKGFQLYSTFRIMGVTCEFVSAREADFVRRIRGKTVDLIYVDELTLISKANWNHILGRCVDGTKILATTNPDHPNFYVKKDIIDRDGSDGIKHLHFILEDNPILSKQQIDDFKKSITDPLIYRRYVLGEWVAAEGVIYNFDSSKHVVSEIPFKPERYLLGVDYGVSNPFACSLIACNSTQSLPTLVACDEIYYDGRRSYGKKSPAEYTDMVDKQWGHLKERIECFVDPSASAMILELRNRGYRTLPTKNDVQPGIQTVSNLFSNGELCIMDSCTKTLNEIYSYRWDESYADRTGNERPIKENDHLPDAIRYAVHSKFGSLGYFRKLEAEKAFYKQPTYTEAMIAKYKQKNKSYRSISEPYIPLL